MKIQRSIAAFSCVLFCLLACYCFFSWADAADGTVYISSAEELSMLNGVDLSGRTIVLKRDITLKDNHTSFSVSGAIIDGGGYSVYGVSKPVFNVLNNTTVKNLGIYGASVSGRGILANTINNTNVDSCYFDGRVSGTKSGFIAGSNLGGKISNVAVSGKLTSDATGIFFGANEGSVQDSWFAGTVSGQISGTNGYSNCYYDKEAAGRDIGLSDLKNAKLSGSWNMGYYPTLKKIKTTKYGVPFIRNGSDVDRGISIAARTADGKALKSGQQTVGPITVTAVGHGDITYTINGGKENIYTGPVVLTGKETIKFYVRGGYSKSFTANTGPKPSSPAVGGNTGGSGANSGNGGGSTGVRAPYKGSDQGEATQESPAYESITENTTQDETMTVAPDVRDPMNGNVVESDPTYNSGLPSDDKDGSGASMPYKKSFGGEAALLVVAGGVLVKKKFV